MNARYKLISRLGGGGFGDAYEAQDLEFPNRSIVIKVAKHGDPEAAAALRREFELTHRLRHRHICRYFDYGVDSDTNDSFLVMEYGGDSIEDRIQAEGQIDPKTAIGLIVQIADALDHVHENDEVHADISPGNILLDARGEARLCDFGVAVEARQQARTGGVTRVGSNHYGYHPVYRAPEVPPVRSRSDQYSLALVLCSMLHGEIPIDRYEFQPFGFLSEAQNAAIARALEEHARNRFESCGAFAAALTG